MNQFTTNKSGCRQSPESVYSAAAARHVTSHQDLISERYHLDATCMRVCLGQDVTNTAHRFVASSSTFSVAVLARSLANEARRKAACAVNAKHDAQRVFKGRLPQCIAQRLLAAPGPSPILACKRKS